VFLYSNNQLDGVKPYFCSVRFNIILPSMQLIF